MRANHAGNKDTVAGIGEDHIVLDTVRKLQLFIAHRVTVHLKLAGYWHGFAGIFKLAGKIDDDAGRLRLIHRAGLDVHFARHSYQAPFCDWLALSLSCWRQRATVEVRLLRFSSRCVNTCSA